MKKISLAIIAIPVLLWVAHFIKNDVLKLKKNNRRNTTNNRRNKRIPITTRNNISKSSTKNTQSTNKPLSTTAQQKKSQFIRQPTQAQRSQRELDDYIFKNHTLQEIGKIYERYIGYLLEQKNFSVQYHGIKYGVKDQGIDLIATSNTEVLLVQVKNWSKNKIIHENHLNQLYGAATKYTQSHPDTNKKHYAVFMTSTTLSEEAKNTAKILKIKYYENIKLDKSYPMIKCKINRRTGNRIYHLPTDQHYDNATINRERGEKYVRTVAEAESLGFRRAYRWKKEK